MATIITRAGKGTPLTNTEVDDNFTNLNTDKAELSGATFTGNVGIGASPDSKLHVSSTDSVSITQTHTDGNTVSFKQSGTGGDVEWRNGNGEALILTGSQTRMRIDSSGNVGIGTTSPAYPLEVSKVGNSGTGSIGLVPDSDNGHTIRYGGTGTNNNVLRFVGTGDAERMRIDSAGNVGIGTTSPDQKLDINNGSLRLETTGSQYVFASDTGAVKAGHRYHAGNNFVATYTASTERMRINSSGNVGIGTDSPAYRLDVSRADVGILARFQTNDGTNNPRITLETTATGVKARSAFGTGIAGSFEIESAGGNSYIALKPDETEAMRINSSGNVGIGTTNPTALLHLESASAPTLKIDDSDSTFALELSQDGSDGSMLLKSAGTLSIGVTNNSASDTVSFQTQSTERMRIDSSGRLLVGTTDTSIYDNTSGGNTGFVYSPNHLLQVARETTTSTQSVMNLNKMGSDGNIIEFYKDGSQAGSIGTIGGELYIQSDDVGLQFDASGNDIVPYGGGFKDATIDLGSSANRFKDIYRSGSTYSTSDRNKKQDIRDLTDAEARVATVAKGSLKAFRYIDSVEAEGDEANIHFGIIAQDLKAAFEAEGLNANDYQVFKTSTYTDDDGVEQTTYSICYENLLAFIIAAI